MEQKVKNLEHCEEMTINIEQKINRNLEKKLALQQFREDELEFLSKEKFFTVFEFYTKKTQFEILQSNLQDEINKLKISEQSLTILEDNRRQIMEQLDSDMLREAGPLKEKLKQISDQCIKSRIDFDTCKARVELETDN
jgi:3-phenylpropionate/cinnamic acid dioxygenase small subunit